MRSSHQTGDADLNSTGSAYISHTLIVHLFGIHANELLNEDVDCLLKSHVHTSPVARQLLSLRSATTKHTPNMDSHVAAE